MRILIVIVCLLLVGAKPKPLSTALRKAEQTYALQVTKIREEAASKQRKAAKELVDSYRVALRAATKAGDFETAQALNQRIKSLEQEVKKTSRQRPTANRITVISAMYGVNQSWKDVTDKIQRAVNGRTTWVYTVSDADLGTPAPGFGCTLVIRYVYDGKVRLRATYVGRKMQLPGK